ncbi:unnamed protein product [Owenia fusiformis]|uniref:Uncharacterized protein n=1 Tax=Owenia fusiformis TaxID=6347 RepID=A0A8S4Q8K5_OWEFU|nr:unnamed protein product [Owenia fusiformis]
MRNYKLQVIYLIMLIVSLVSPYDQIGQSVQENVYQYDDIDDDILLSPKRSWNTFCPLRAVKGFLCCSRLNSCICRTKLLCNSKRLDQMALARLRHKLLTLKRAGQLDIKKWIIRMTAHPKRRTTSLK